MQAKDINNYFHKSVIYNNSEYILTGIMKRKNDKGFYYQAELTDKCKNSVCMVKIEDVEVENNV